MKGYLGVVLSLAICAPAMAQVFECGASACAANVQPWSVNVITGIDGLRVDGDLFNVSFSNTAPAVSPFVFSFSAASAGQPLTGVDAGAALDAFYASLQPPYGGYPVVGDPGPAFITAMAPAGALSANYFGASTLYDLQQTTVGGGYKIATQIVGSNDYSGNGGTVQFTSWTRVAQAPEIDAPSMASALTLLAGVIALVRARDGKPAEKGSRRRPL